MRLRQLLDKCHELLLIEIPDGCDQNFTSINVIVTFQIGEQGGYDMLAPCAGEVRTGALDIFDAGVAMPDSNAVRNRPASLDAGLQEIGGGASKRHDSTRLGVLAPPLERTLGRTVPDG